MSKLQRELEVYEAALPSLLAMHQGQYVVIKDSDVRHYSETYEQALSWAYDAFGLDLFFVKQIADSASASVNFTRDLGPCTG